MTLRTHDTPPVRSKQTAIDKLQSIISNASSRGGSVHANSHYRKITLKAVDLREGGNLLIKVHPIFKEDGPKHARAGVDEIEPKICFASCDSSEKANPDEKVLVLVR